MTAKRCETPDGCGNCKHWSSDDESMFEGTCTLTFRRVDQDDLCKRYEADEVKHGGDE